MGSRRGIDHGPGPEIEVAISADGDVFWYRRLRTENYRCGWRESTVEGVRTGYGTGALA
jgi:hypothetical protein